MSDTVSWDRDKLKRFRAVVSRLVRDKEEETFTFEGREYDLRYAHYLIEYLEERLAK